MKQKVEKFLLRAAEEGDVRLLRSAIDNGANVNYADEKTGFTALHFACYFGHLDIVTQLLAMNGDGGAAVAVDIDALTVSGTTPLMIAVLNGHQEIVELLLSQPIQPDLMLSNAVDFDGDHGHFTVLHFAVIGQNSDVLRMIAEGRSGAFYTAQSNLGFTAIHLATDMKLTKLAQELLGYEKESFVDIHGNSFHQINRGHGLHKDSSIPGTLTDPYVPSLHAVTEDGRTPLHLASIFGEPELVKTFLVHGAKVDAQDVYGFTPLHWAALLGFDESVQVLLQYGADQNRMTALLQPEQRKNLLNDIKMYMLQYQEQQSADPLNDETLSPAVISSINKFIAYLETYASSPLRNAHWMERDSTAKLMLSSDTASSHNSSFQDVDALPHITTQENDKNPLHETRNQVEGDIEVATRMANSACSGNTESAVGTESITIEVEGGLGSINIDMEQLNYDVTGDWESSSMSDGAAKTQKRSDSDHRKSFIDDIIDVMDDQFKATFAELDAKLLSSDKSCSNSDSKGSSDSRDHLSPKKKMKAKEKKRMKGQCNKKRNKKYSSPSRGDTEADDNPPPRSRSHSTGASSASMCSSLKGRKRRKCVKHNSKSETDSNFDEVDAISHRRFQVLPGQSDNDEYSFIEDNDEDNVWIAATDFDSNADSTQHASDLPADQRSFVNGEDGNAAQCVDATQWVKAKSAVRKYRTEANNWRKVAAAYKKLVKNSAAHHTAAQEGLKSEGEGRKDECTAMSEYDRLYLNTVCIMLLLISLSLVIFIRMRL